MSATPAEFRPDLIVEATNACDRVCAGCYAPNVFVGRQAAAGAPQADYLSLESLNVAWPVRERVETVAIRGGEPTLNPDIDNILKFVSKRAAQVYLETHGGWIREGHPLLPVLIETHCTAKLSLDRMHGTSPETARRIIDILDTAGIKMAVAVTETSREQFQETRERLLSGFRGEVFRQNKATNQKDLVRPAIGVISAKGGFQQTVTHQLIEAYAL